MKEDKTRFSLMYEGFEYKGYSENYYDYDIPFDTFIEGIRKYFDNQMINLDGKDNDIWNAFVDLDCLDNIFEAMEDWFHEYCKEDAFEEFKEYVEEWELDNE